MSQGTRLSCRLVPARSIPRRHGGTHRKYVVLLAAVAALVVLVLPATSSAASSGGYLGVGTAKAEIKSYMRDTAVGTRFAAKVDTCYKPRADRVTCFFQTREWFYDLGEWMQCYGTATVTDRWSYVDVKPNRGWVDDCYFDTSSRFI